VIVKFKHRKGNVCQLQIQVTECIDLNVEGLSVVLIPLFVGNLPVPVAARSMAEVFGRSPTEIVGSNPTGSMDICLL